MNSIEETNQQTGQAQSPTQLLVRPCVACRWHVYQHHCISTCTRTWHDLVTGEVATPNGTMFPCWYARKEFCTPAGAGFEPKEDQLPQVIGYVRRNNGIIGPGYGEWSEPVFDKPIPQGPSSEEVQEQWCAAAAYVKSVIERLSKEL